MRPEDFKADIPLDQAIAAHNGTSFSPESRGAAQVEGFAREMAADFNTIMGHANTDEMREKMIQEFARYREGMRTRTLAYLSARSRCISTMITGPANFPVRRAEKASNTAQRRLNDLVEFRKRAMAAIIKAAHPERRPIMSGDEDAVDRLAEKLAAATAEQELMKSVNASIRKTRVNSQEFRIAALVELGLNETEAARKLVPDSMGTIGYPPWRLTNNNANIKRLSDRLRVLTAAKAAPATQGEGENARWEVDAAANRVRIFFPGKPEAAIRERLKGGGFRWAPTAGAWMAYINERTRNLAREIAGQTK